MKLKYYLRGVGIGILVSTIILMIAFSNHSNEMSDAEVMKRASELGMVMKESTTGESIPEGTEKNTSQPQTQTEADVMTESENTENAENTQTTLPDGNTEQSDVPLTTETDTQSSVSTEAPDVPQEPDVPDTPDVPQEPVEFTVVRGDSSNTVATRLFEAGLVDDAQAFNTYMVENNYDDYILPGTVAITPGATYEEIVKILTGK